MCECVACPLMDCANMIVEERARKALDNKLADKGLKYRKSSGSSMQTGLFKKNDNRIGL